MPEPNFRFFIACEDQAGFLHAKNVQEQVEASCGGEIKISRVLWSFALLRHQQLRACAAMEAAEAEMIVIALRAASALPSHVRLWLESLPARPQAGQAAMVMLIGSRQEPWAARQSHIADIRRIAESRGLDFFCNHNDWKPSSLLNPAFRDVESGAAAVKNIISDHISWSTGGINE